MREYTENRIRGEVTAALQACDSEREDNRDNENTEQRRNIEHEAKRYAKQRRVSDRRAETRHLLPDCETTEGPRNQCDTDPAKNRPDEIIIQQC